MDEPSPTVRARGSSVDTQVKLFDTAVKCLRQNYARRSIEMIEIFARAKKKVIERQRFLEG